MLEKVNNQSETSTTRGDETRVKRRVCVENDGGFRTNLVTSVDGRCSREQQGAQPPQHPHSGGRSIQVGQTSATPSFLFGWTHMRDAETNKNMHSHDAYAFGSTTRHHIHTQKKC